MLAYVRFVLRHRFLILTALVLVTAVSGLSLRQAVVASSIGKLFLGDSPAYRDYSERVHEFGSDELLVVGYEDGDVLSAESLRRLQRVVSRLESIPSIDRAQSILDTRRIFLTGDEDFVESFIEGMASDPLLKEETLDELLGDDIARGTVISNDGRHGAVILTLADPSARPVENNIELVDGVLSAFVEAGYDADRIHRTGSVPVVSEMMAQTHFNLRRLFPIVCVLLALTVFVIFRRLWPVAVSAAVAIVGVTWTMGIAVWIDPEVNILMAAVPAVVLIISFSDVIHLSSAYLIELSADGTDRRSAILASATDVGAACVFTSMTTFVGFVCLSLVPTPVFRQLGLVLGLGVGIALLVALTLVPILFSLMPRPRPWRTGIASHSQSIIDRFLAICARISTTRPRLVIAAFAILLVASVFGITRIEVENRLSRRLDEHNRVRRDGEWFDERFAGTNVVDLYIDTNDRGDVLDPGVFERLAEIHDGIEAMDTVDVVISPVALVREVEARVTEGDSGEPSTPRERQDIEQHLTALEIFDAGALEMFIDENRQTVRMLARVNDEGLRQTHRTGLEGLAIASEKIQDEGSAEATGMSFLIGGWLDNIVEGQRRGLIASFLTIAVLMILALRSIRVGLFSMVPNLLPLLALGGHVGFWWDHVDSDTFLVAMLAIGIGVDDTIHFLVRYRIEARREPDRTTALLRTFDFAGRGIVITTIILTVGFLPFTASDYFSLRILGTLLPLVLVVALLADVLLVPAMGAVGLLRFHGVKRTITAAIVMMLALVPTSSAMAELPKSGDCPDGLESFDRLMTSFLEEHEVPGAALAVVRDGKLVVARGYGWADRDAKRPVEPKSLFRIASISKPVTAVAILGLVEQGKLRLDDKIDGLLKPRPHLEDGATVDPRLRDITVRQLLRHTGGFDRSVSFDPMFRSVEFAEALGADPPAGTEQIIRCMWGRPLDFDPGARYAYSNFGYCLLGRVIEKAGGEPYESYVKRHVLAPLGIRDMRVGATRREKRAPREVTYHARGRPTSPAVVGKISEKVATPYGAWYHESLDAHGGWIASAVDLVRFACAFDDPERCAVLRKTSIATMFARPAGLAGHDRDGGPKPAFYACGWMVRPLPEVPGENHWHTGSLPGTSTILVRRHDGLRWAVLFNQRVSTGSRHVAATIDPLVHRAANAVKTWPPVDLFEKYR